MKIMPHEWPGYVAERHIDEYTDEELESMPRAHVCRLPGSVVSGRTLYSRIERQGMGIREAATKPLGPSGRKTKQ